MFKLVVLCALIAGVLAGVVPKPPAAAHAEKNEEPSVKSVPLYSSHHSSPENHKPTEIKHAEVKQAEQNKPQEKSAKKDEHLQADVKKAEPHTHHEAIKHDAFAKTGHEHHPADVVKDAHKNQQAEVASVKTAEQKH